MSTTAERQTSDRGQKVDGLDAYTDAWELLNASEEELRAAAAGYPDPDKHVNDLLDLLEGLRETYRAEALRPARTLPPGAIVAPVVEAMSLAKKAGVAIDIAQQIADAARQSAARIKTVGTLAMQYGLVDRGAKEAGDVIRIGKGKGERWVVPVLVDSRLFDAVREPLEWLIHGITHPTGSIVYACERCGKIGLAQRRTRRFCGTACRVAVHIASQR